MGKIEKAHLEAMKALERAKENPDISEEAVEDIKQAHREFMERQEKREQETAPSRFSATQERPKGKYAASTSAPHTPKQGKGKWMWKAGGIVAVLLLVGVGYYLFTKQSAPVVYDTIWMKNDVWNKGLERSYRREFSMTYPTEVGKYDLTGFYKELFERYFSGSRLLSNGKEMLKKKAENLDFKEAARKIVQEEDFIDDYSMKIHCDYDADRGWVAVSATEITCPTGHCYYNSSFFYSLEKLKVMEFNDIFLPEKQDKLKKMIRERIIDDHLPTPGELLRKDWEPDIRKYDLIKEDSVWCWQFDCVTNPDIDLPYAYYPLRVTIPEKGLTGYLAYPVPKNE